MSRIKAEGRKSSRRVRTYTASRGSPGLRLSELRKQCGITQAGLAEALGVSQSAISQMEAQNDIQTLTLSHIAKALGGRLRLAIDFPQHSVRLCQFQEDQGSKKQTNSGRRVRRAGGGSAVRKSKSIDREAQMGELKKFIVKYEMLGADLARIVDLYNQQRSEEVIEDMEKEIDQSANQNEINDAINESYL
jgi:transcriptional regulator with XRE-family HTH domain